jgi:hypothetical protein
LPGSRRIISRIFSICAMTIMVPLLTPRVNQELDLT